MSTKNNDQFQPQGPDSSEDGKVACRNSSGSLDSMAKGRIVENELENALDEKGQDGLQIFTETSRGFVNTNDTPIVDTQHEETVNTREHSARERQLRSVHNKDGLNMENQFAEGDEFD